MKNTIWMIFVFFGMLYIAPVLMIIMALSITDIPLYYAAACWLPIAIIGSLLMAFWYHRQGINSVQS